MTSIYLRSASIYRGDFDCKLYCRDYEFFPGSQALPASHYHDFYEIQFYLSDAGSIFIGENEYPLRKRSVVLIKLFEPHCIKLRTDGEYYERFCISLNPSFLLTACTNKSNLLSMFQSENKNYPIFSLSQERFDQYQDLFLRYERLTDSEGQDIMERAIIYEIIANLYFDLYDAEAVKAVDTQVTAFVSELVRFVHEHINENLALDTLAKEFSYSKYYLCRLFKRYTGKTLHEYINEKRIEIAKYHLVSNTAIGEICQLVGYQNYSHFYKTFLRQVGVSPQEYREAMKKERLREDFSQMTM